MSLIKFLLEKIMQFFLSMPLNSVSCERGFRVQNRMRTKSQARLGEERLDQIMRSTINGPDFAVFHYQLAAEKFKAMKNHIK